MAKILGTVHLSKGSFVRNEKHRVRARAKVRIYTTPFRTNDPSDKWPFGQVTCNRDFEINTRMGKTPMSVQQ